MQKNTKVKSIKTRLITIMLLICAVPLIVAVAISYVSSMEDEKDQAETLNLKEATIAKEDFISIIDQNMQVLQAMANSPYVREFLMSDEGSRDLDNNERISKVRRCVFSGRQPDSDYRGRRYADCQKQRRKY